FPASPLVPAAASARYMQTARVIKRAVLPMERMTTSSIADDSLDPVAGPVPRRDSASQRSDGAVRRLWDGDSEAGTRKGAAAANGGKFSGSGIGTGSAGREDEQRIAADPDQRELAQAMAGRDPVERRPIGDLRHRTPDRSAHGGRRRRDRRPRR